VKLEADVFGTLEDRVQLPRVYDVWHSGRLFGPDDAALDVMSQILGGGKSSRLYKRLVYELQIANQVAAYNDAGRKDGKLMMVATATPGHALDELQRVIDEELARLAQSGPTERELQRVQNGIEAQFLDGMQQVGGFTGKANQLNYYEFFVGKPDYFNQDLERYQKLTTADIQRVAREYVTGAHRVVLSIVPQGKTELAVTEGRKP
jgi:zinc protease